jgi:hypothetical protein
MYADDSIIHFSRKHISDIQTKVQEDLNRIELWCKDNRFFQFRFESILIPSNFSQVECCNCSELIVKDSSSFIIIIIIIHGIGVNEKINDINVCRNVII